MALLEKALDKELVWIACRHHVFEVMLSDVFSAILGPTSGPDIGLLKRFQKMWPHVNKTDFKPASDDMFIGIPDGLKQELMAFYALARRHERTTWSCFDCVMFSLVDHSTEM